MIKMREPNSKFIRVVCKKCKNEQTVFTRSATLVKCLKCEDELVLPTGGESKILGKVFRVLS